MSGATGSLLAEPGSSASANGTAELSVSVSTSRAVMDGKVTVGASGMCAISGSTNRHGGIYERRLLVRVCCDYPRSECRQLEHDCAVVWRFV